MSSHKHLSRITCDLYNSEERVQIDLSNAEPYRWICHLKLKVSETPNDDDYGTGFLINIPGSRKCIILTAAHVLYKYTKKRSGTPGYVKEILVKFPGQREPTVIDDPRSFIVHDEYKTNGNLERDFGIIILPDEKLPRDSCGFGIAAVMTDRELLESDLSVFGYPYLERAGENGTMWGSGGRVQSLDESMIRFIVQTTPGQSGSPVFVWDQGFWTVVGVHVHDEMISGYTVNAAVRLNASIMNTIIGWTKHPYHKVSLRFGSERFLSIPRAAPEALGTYHSIWPTKTQDESTLVNIVPVRSYPDGCAQPYSKNQWVIVSSRFPNSYICIDELATMKNLGQPKDNIVVRSRLKRAPIFNRSCEVVYFDNHCLMPSDDELLNVKSIRFPTPDKSETPVWIAGDKFDISSLKIVNLKEQ